MALSPHDIVMSAYGVPFWYDAKENSMPLDGTYAYAAPMGPWKVEPFKPLPPVETYPSNTVTFVSQPDIDQRLQVLEKKVDLLLEAIEELKEHLAVKEAMQELMDKLGKK